MLHALVANRQTDAARRGFDLAHSPEHGPDHVGQLPVSSWAGWVKASGSSALQGALGSIHHRHAAVLQRTLGNHAVLRILDAGQQHLRMSRPSLAADLAARTFLQPKLRVNEPGDAYEREADCVADQVMHMPDPVPVSRSNLSGTGLQIARHLDQPQVQRCGDTPCNCSAKEKAAHAATTVGPTGGLYDEALPLERSPASTFAQLADPTTAPSIVHQVLRSPGRPLDTSTRAFMEPRFGYDFNGVRVHTDAQAAESAREVNALAYTVGSDVIFGAGRYAPGMDAGRRLLAHELAHAVQQSPARHVQSAHIVRQGNVEEASFDMSDAISDLSLIKRTAEQDPRLFRQQDLNAAAQDLGAPGATSDEGQNDLPDIEWMPQRSSAAAGQSSAEVSGGPPVTDSKASPEITLETGNNTWNPLNNALHQQVCVVAGPKDDKYCFSFAAIGRQTPQFSSTWLGWDSEVVGAYIKGEIYSPDPVPEATVVSRLTPTAAQAARWKNYMIRRRFGLRDAYSTARHNCRTFSQWEFRDAPSQW